MEFVIYYWFIDNLLSKGYTLKDINCLVKEAFEGLGCISYERSKIKEVNVYIDVEAEII